MLFFCVDRDVAITGNWSFVVSAGKPSDRGDYRFALKGLPVDAAAAGPALFDTIYIGSAYEVECTRTGLGVSGLPTSLRVLGTQDQSRVAFLPEFPRHIGRTRGASLESVSLATRLEPLLHKNPLRVAVLNGMGSGLGDSIAGLRALEIFHRELLRAAPCVEIDLFQGPRAERLRPLYERHPSVNRLRALPVPVTEFLHYDAYVDLSDLFRSDDSTAQPLIDVFLAELSINPGRVPAAEKRARLHLDPAAVERVRSWVEDLRADGRPLLLFHPTATCHSRSMPVERVAPFLESLNRGGDYVILSAVALDYVHPRFTCVADRTAHLSDFLALVSLVDAVVTVDTVTYHAADAFSVPTVVVFTTILPEFRIPYYPHTAGILLAPDHAATGHHSDEGMTDAQLTSVRESWAALDAQHVLKELDRLRG